jgi:integrase
MDTFAIADVEYVRPHRHRHTAASFAGHTGVDPIDIQKMLGHAQLETTSKFYLHTDAKRQISEKDRLTEARLALRKKRGVS